MEKKYLIFSLVYIFVASHIFGEIENARNRFSEKF